MIVVRRIADLRTAVDALRASRPVGFVPTMGALHEGHANLFRQAGRDGFGVVASVFVNPRQFNDPADLAAYPRDEPRDVALADASGVDVLFLPSAAEIYPEGHATVVDVKGPADGYEGAARPGHFAGVATVCLTFFNVVRPDAAFFGQKDAQQVAVVRQLVRDLALGVEIRVAPTSRDADGLARSSRNARLTPGERARAAAVPAALRAGLDAHRRGADPAAAARRELSGLDVEYVDVATFDGRDTLVLAVWLGRTRLIDNVPLDDPALAGLEGPTHVARNG
jgi:pantoate--beta-alanine ligase